MVQYGIIAIGCTYEKHEYKVNLQPFKAQMDNHKQPDFLKENPVVPKEAMQHVDQMLTQAIKDGVTHLVVIGDYSGINYYLNMCEFGTLFQYKFKTFECVFYEKNNLILQKDPLEVCKAFMFEQKNKK